MDSIEYGVRVGIKVLAKDAGKVGSGGTKKRDMYTYHFNALFVKNKVKNASANDPQGYKRDATRT